MLAETLDQDIIGEFLDVIYADQSGYVYVATKNPEMEPRNPQPGDWVQRFFVWPKERELMVAYIIAARQSSEVYYGPAIFSEQSATKRAVKSSAVAWVEFDGRIPNNLDQLPAPHIRVQSSESDHQHWYWRLDAATNPGDLERINRSLSYHLGADTSGWDANQVLRPPGTFNHKRNCNVSLLASSLENRVSLSDFSGLSDPPPPGAIPLPSALPDLSDTLGKYKIPTKVWTLFRNGAPVGKRSEALMSLGYSLAELQFDDFEVFVVLADADRRWGKFFTRQDREIRLMEIVTRARVKYPLRAKEEGNLVSVGFLTLRASEVKLDWVWDGFLQSDGFFLLTGPSGVGKTQTALQICQSFALGNRELFGRSVGESRKVGFFSLEMGLADIKFFLDQQAQEYTEQRELDLLEENFRVFPLGEPLHLTDEQNKERIREVIERENLRGVVFDSMGSTTARSISDDENAKELVDWVDHLRNQTGSFAGFIHHHRKASGTNKRPNKLEDVYGNQYITARPTTVICLWPTVNPGIITAIPLKVRLAPTPAPFDLRRNKYLIYNLVESRMAKPGEVFAEELADKEQDGGSLFGSDNF